MNLPPAAPSVALKSLYNLIRHLERKNEALKKRLSIAKLSPQVQFPTTAGVDGITDIIEKELRQAAADEQTKANKNSSEATDPAANKGKGKGKSKQGKYMEEKKNQLCLFLNGPRGCTFGDKCHYKHPGKSNPPNPNPKAKPKAEPSKRKCAFHKRKGGCIKGDQCPFIHEGPSGSSKAEAPKALVGAGQEGAAQQAKAAAKPKAKNGVRLHMPLQKQPDSVPKGRIIFCWTLTNTSSGDSGAW